MNCNTCRYELSQCLDGRLPSGRRAVVMQHTVSCEACAEFWDELQSAQRLALQLPCEQVGESFREQLWQRIRVGEGTPDAVFREPVPMLVKVRYSLTGAAAAAAVLLFGLWLRNDPVTNVAEPTEENVAIVADEPPPARPVEPARVEQRDPVSMLSSAQPLTANLVAVETARQIESRYDSMNLNLRQLRTQQRQPHGVREAQPIVDRIVQDANELRIFAEVLLEMRDYDRVSFRDPEVGAELRLVTNLLEPRQLRLQSVETFGTFVGRTVQQSPRLGRITRHIRVTPPSRDRYEEAGVLIEMNNRRPEVFTKLFIVFGQGDQISQNMGLFPQNHLYLFEDVCGAVVAPRSEFESQSWIR